MRILPWNAPGRKPGVQVLVVGNTRTTRTEFDEGAASGILAGGPPPRGSAPVTAILTADLVAGRTELLALQPDLDTVVVSVVPPADRVLLEACPRAGLLRADDAPIAIHYDPPESLGADRIANALAACDLFGTPVLVVDCGTATTLTLVDASGALAGGAIAPGLTPSIDALRQHTPHLPPIEVEIPPSPLGQTTVHSLQSGVVLGHAGMIRHLAGEMAPGVPIVLAGGWARLFETLIPGAVRHGNLTAWGGRVYWKSCIRGNQRDRNDGG